MSSFKGTWLLVRLALRRDRAKLGAAIVSVGLLVPMFVAGISNIFSGEAERVQAIAFLAANPAMRLFGLPTGGDFGNLLMLRVFTFLAIIIALISTFTVVRHTRQNEELGRFELIGAGAVGRYAGLSAALIVAFGANIVMATLIFIGLLSGDFSISGSALMALAASGVGMAFSVIAAVCVQFTQTSRAANGIAAGTVGAGFLLSGIGSLLGELKPSGLVVEPAWPVWLSPFGWGQMLEPFASENWWVLLVFVSFFTSGIVAAMVLSSKRDVGMGIFDARRGREAAAKSLLSLPGLAWRLQKGIFLSWLAGIVLMSIIYGVIAGDAEQLLGEAEGIARVFISASGAEEIMTAFFGAIMGVLGIFALAYAVQITLRLRSDEIKALEALLSTSLDRTKWWLVQVGFTLFSTAGILLASSLALGFTAKATMSEEIDIIWPVVAGGLVQLPAIFILVGLITAMFGLWPKIVNNVTWTAVAVAIVAGPFMGSMLNLPEWAMNISPLTHIPSVPPVDNIEAVPLLILSAIAATLLTIGAQAFRQRDINST